MRKVRWILASALAAAVLVGCETPNRQYVEADRATYETIAPEYLRYVNSDAALDPDAKEVRRLNVAAWELRIRHAEGAAK